MCREPLKTPSHAAVTERKVAPCKGVSMLVRIQSAVRVMVDGVPLTGDRKRAYQREWVAKRRAEYFADKCCARCSSTENMELDHIDPRQKVSNSIWSWSAERRNIELAKCQILCRPCHVKKTVEQLILTHGFQAYRHGRPKPEVVDAVCVGSGNVERMQVAVNMVVVAERQRHRFVVPGPAGQRGFESRQSPQLDIVGVGQGFVLILPLIESEPLHSRSPNREAPAGVV